MGKKKTQKSKLQLTPQQLKRQKATRKAVKSQQKLVTVKSITGDKVKTKAVSTTPQTRKCGCRRKRIG